MEPPALVVAPRGHARSIQHGGAAAGGVASAAVTLPQESESLAVVIIGDAGSIAAVTRAAEGFGGNPPQSVISQVGCTAARVGLRG